MSAPRHQVIPFVAGIALAALLAGCGGGGNDASAKPPALPAASATTFAADAGQAFADSDWGFPTSGTSWYREHETHAHRDGSGSDVVDYQERAATLGTNLGASAVLTTTTTHDEGGGVVSTRAGAWTVGANGIVYVWTEGLAHWLPFAPAHVHAGQSWSLSASGAAIGLELTEQATVVSTSATSPSGHAGCIQLDITVTSVSSGGSGSLHFDHYSSHTVTYVAPGLGTVETTSDTTSDGTALGIPFDDHAVQTLERLDAPPVFAISAAG